MPLGCLATRDSAILNVPANVGIRERRRDELRVDNDTASRFTRNVNKALILFLTCALSPLFAFADEESEALVKKAGSGDPAALV